MKKLLTSPIHLFLLLSVIILMVVQVLIFNKDSTNGKKLKDINRETKDIEEQNVLLTQQIASASSISTISNLAVGYGFNSTSNIVSLSGALPIASAKNISL